MTPVGRRVAALAVVVLVVAAGVGVGPAAAAGAGPGVAPAGASNATSADGTAAGSTAEARRATAARATGVVRGDRRRTPLFDVSFDVRGRLAVGESTPVRVTVEARRAVADVRGSVLAPTRFETNRSDVALGSMAPGEVRTVTVGVEPTAGVSRTLRVRLAGATVDGPFARTHAGRLDATGGTVGIASPDGDDATTRPVSPTVTVTDAGAGGDDAVGTAATTARVVGTATYDADGGTHPMRDVEVVVMDADSSGDEVLARGRTDDAGRFDVAFDPTGADANSNADVYVRVLSENTAAVGVDPNGTRYALDTRANRVSDVGTGAVVDAGTLVPAEYNPAWRAIDDALTAARYVDAEAGWSREQVTIEWPVGDWPYHGYRYYQGSGDVLRDSESIRLPSRSAVAWDAATVHHEYGHAVMIAAYDWNANELPDTGGFGSHYVFSETNPGFAVVEGWAEFVETAVVDDPDVIANRFGDVETNHWYDADYPSTNPPGSDAGEMDGNSVEGSAASVWYDMIDEGNANDESMAVSFGAVFDTLRTTHTQSMTDFYGDWDGGHRAELAATYHRYGIPVNRPPTADAGPNRTVDAGASVGLDATGSTDPDGDPLSYEWTQVEGPVATLSGATTAEPTLTAPDVGSPTTLEFAVSVADGDGGVDTDVVAVVVEPPASTSPSDPFPDGVPGVGSDPPTDPIDAGGHEDVNGDGVADFADVLDFLFATDDLATVDLTADQRAALDYDGDAAVSFNDVVALLFRVV